MYLFSFNILLGAGEEHGGADQATHPHHRGLCQEEHGGSPRQAQTKPGARL